MNDAPVYPPALESAGSRRSENWSTPRRITIIALVAAVQIALIFVFGEKQAIHPRAALHVPTLKLADNTGEQIALNDPTLFVLPNPKDFASAIWLKREAQAPPIFRWTESPRWLPLNTNSLGGVFGDFMKYGFSAGHAYDYKPEAIFTTPTLPVLSARIPNSTMLTTGELAQRQLPCSISLTNWPYAEVLAPCVVQILVDPAGNVVSWVLLKSSNYKNADDKALELASTQRYTPSTHLTFGRIIFNWQTVPPIPTP